MTVEPESVLRVVFDITHQLDDEIRLWLEPEIEKAVRHRFKTSFPEPLYRPLKLRTPRKR